MNINSLKMFCDAAQLGSFSRAAEKNAVTQSTISQTVANLEKHLNKSLINRTLRPWQLTNAGRQLFEGAHSIVQDYLKLESAIRDFDSETGGILRISSIYSMGIGKMQKYTDDFKKQNPAINISLKYEHPNRILAGVSKGRFDVGIISFPRQSKIIAVEPLFEEPMVLACPPYHRFSGLERIFLHQIHNEKFVTFDNDLIIRKEIDGFLRSNDISVRVVLEFDNIEAIKRAVEAGSGIALLPKPTIEREIKMGTLAGVQFSPENMNRPVGLIYHKSMAGDANIHRFVKHLKREFW